MCRQAEKYGDDISELKKIIDEPRVLNRAAGYLGLSSADKYLGSLVLLHKMDKYQADAITASRSCITVNSDTASYKEVLEMAGPFTVTISWFGMGSFVFLYDPVSNTASIDHPQPDGSIAKELNRVCKNIKSLDLASKTVRAFMKENAWSSAEWKVLYDLSADAVSLVITAHTTYQYTIPMDDNLQNTVMHDCSEAFAEKTEYVKAKIAKLPYLGSYAAEAIAKTVLDNDRYITAKAVKRTGKQCNQYRKEE